LRVVLDTNVLVSAALRPDGPNGQIVRLARGGGRLQLVTSSALLTELWEVLRRPTLSARIPVSDARSFVESVRDNSEIRDDPPDPARVARDPKDDFVLALALSAAVEALISGDRDLLEIAEPPLTILTPRQLLDRLGS
jgi:putative PIN family toxin of toxin-antitoxin system